MALKYIKKFVLFIALVFCFVFASFILSDMSKFPKSIKYLRVQYNDAFSNSTTSERSMDSSRVYKVYPAGHLFGKTRTWMDYFKHWKPGSNFTCDNGVRCQLVSRDVDADIIIFHGRELASVNLKDMLKRRKVSQRWVFFSWESIVNANVRFKPEWRRQFNWTATYMRDSDAMAPYYRGYMELTPEEALKASSRPLYQKNKKLLAFAVISNCQAKARLKLIRSLQRFMKIDLFGKCGQKLKGDHGSIRELSRNYRFYLAFENSRCQDYITEKFWYNGLTGDAVPVAVGGYSRRDYELVAPPNSFVYAHDYVSAKQLAAFLKQLGANEKEYAKYHEWKRKWKVDEYDMKDLLLCNLCRRAHLDNQQKVALIEKFWDISARCKKRDASGII